MHDRFRLAANTIRALALDATNAADSGHPGAPMGLADIATVVFSEVLRFDPTKPDWLDRDRFVLSNGHASMLLYAALHLTGYDLTLEDLKRFRRLHSKTPGHPEYRLTPGVETTTGPLGQGFANGVGMAIAARMAKARFSAADFSPISHRIFGICGDGCLMEGVSAEAASLAGHLGLGEIIYFYDDNRITIDGGTELSFSEDVKQRFLAYGWQVLRADGHAPEEIRQTIRLAEAETKRPSLIIARTHIGFGSPNRQDTAKAHGEPMGEAETALAKQKLGIAFGPFEIPSEARALFGAQADRGHAARLVWDEKMAAYARTHAERARAFEAHFSGPPKDYWKDALSAVQKESTATRGLSGKVLNKLAEKIPGLIGGSADLAVSNKSAIKGGHVSREDFSGRNLHFGVREHAMAAIVNGIALYGGFVPFGATFLTFSDYMRPALRLAALMKIRSLMIFTHDSIYLGEDGPTHQAVEHHFALRLIPGYSYWRPADGLETAMAWAYAVGQGDPAPHGLAFTRQDVPALERGPSFDPTEVWKGGYILKDAVSPTLCLVATGSEVHVAVGAARILDAEGQRVRVVSMPCLERFNAQPAAHRDAVLPPGILRVSFEIGRSDPWRAIVGLEGLAIGIDQFGDSAPWKALRDHYRFTPEGIADRIRQHLVGSG